MSGGRLWIVSELYYPEQTSTGYFLTGIAEGLAGSTQVEVICGQPTYSEQGQNAPWREERRGVLIHRMRATRFGKDRVLLRLVNLVTLSLAVAWFAFRHFRRGDRLLVVTNPPTLPAIVGIIARWRGVRAHLLVHDVYPDVLAATGHLRRASLPYRLLARLFAATFRLYPTIIVLGRDMAELIKRKIEPTSAKVVVIPNWGNPDEIAPIPQTANPFLAANGIEAPCVIQFSGNIGRTHDIGTIIEAARRLRERADITFLFAGQGGKAGIVAAAIASGALPNVRFLPRQPRAMLGPMLASATATIISFVDEMKGLSVPSRMYNVMAAGVPIIAMADAGSELALVVRENDAGWTLASGDAEGLVRLIVQIAGPGGAEEAQVRGARGRAAVLAEYNLPAVLAQFRSVLID